MSLNIYNNIPLLYYIIASSIEKPIRNDNGIKSQKEIEFVKIIKSPKYDKKYRAVFIVNGREKKVDFGSSGYSDFTKHKDPERKKRYINRHVSRENWDDPITPGALSRYILWNKPTFKASLQDYKKKFGFK